MLTHEEHILVKRLAKRLAKRERKIARENDKKKIQLDLEGLNFIEFMNFINFETFPISQ